MGEPKRDIGAIPSLPSREAISEALLAEEGPLVGTLIKQARASQEERLQIELLASDLVKAAREGRHEQGGLDSLLHEYGLSSEEGVLLLCLAEALLRIPDAATADRLIAGTIGSGDWARHLGHSDSLLVNASTWGLMLTGRVVVWGANLCSARPSKRRLPMPRRRGSKAIASPSTCWARLRARKTMPSAIRFATARRS